MFAERAVEILLSGEGGKAVGLQNDEVVCIDLNESVNNIKPLDMQMLKLAEMLSI